MSPTARISPGLQRAQKLCLDLQRHVANFIEEHGAAVGLFEQSFAVVISARKSAAPVAEEFALQQSGRQCRAVQCDQRMIAARAVAMDGARHQLFPGPALAADQDSRRRRRNLGNQSRDLLHLQVIANDELAFRPGFKFAQGKLVLILERFGLIPFAAQTRR